MAVHRYFRLLVTDYPPGLDPSSGNPTAIAPLREIEFRDHAIGGASSAPYDNLVFIAGGTSSASVNGTASGVFDFDPTGDAWAFYLWDGGVPQWVQWDFGAGNEQEVVEVGLFLGETYYNMAPFKIQQSDDGTTWTDRYTSSGGEGVGGSSITLSYEVPTPANGRPIITSNGGGASASIYVVENTTAVTTVTATDADSDPITFSLSGVDAALFTIDSSTGALEFITAPDYEVPADIDGNNLYQVIVTASDGTDSDTQTLNIFVTDAGPIFTNNGGGTSIALSVDENTTTVTTVVAAGSTYAITGGDDAALFQIDSATGDLSFIAAPDFELPSDANADNDYSIIVSATAGSETAYQSITISVADVLPGVGVEPVAGTNWSRVITIGGVDVSAQITGVCVVEAEESTSRIASFSLRPEAGTISAGDWLGVAVTINYKTVSSSGVEISNNRLFTGIVDQAIYDPTTRLTSFDCTDDMQGRFEAMTQTEINDLIVDSRWSDAVFGDYTDGWRYLEYILSTHPQSYDYNADGVTGTLVAWAAKVTPDFSYDSSGIIDGSISYSITPKRELFNSYTINYSYRFGRLIHRDHNFSWSLNFCPYFAQSHELPTREMITVAATSAGWNLTSAITFKALPDSNVDPCNTGVAWTISDENKELLALGASWKASKRWTQTATENYTITVNAPQSVSWLGEVAFKESASNSTELDADGWADGVETPTGRTNSQGDIVQDKYDRSISNNDLETLIARARTEILSSHRTNFVSADILLNPLLERFHTVRLDDNGIVGQGKVASFVHRTDSDTGEAITSVRIAVSLNGGAAASGDDAITAPSAPTTDPATTAPSNTTVLSTNIGGDDSAPAFDESWDGFSGNYSIPVGLPAGNQYYARRFKVVTPDINQDAVDAIEAEAAAPYSFDIPDETLTITVA